VALLTASELKSSHEALEAGVDSASDAVVESVIAFTETLVLRLLGYDAESFDFEPTDPDHILTKQAVLILAVSKLATPDFPVPPGSYLTNVTSQGADFSMFTPETTSGHVEVDRLLRLITKGPLYSETGLVSAELQTRWAEVADPDSFQ
jgi:hypothetical protein